MKKFLGEPASVPSAFLVIIMFVLIMELAYIIMDRQTEFNWAGQIRKVERENKELEIENNSLTEKISDLEKKRDVYQDLISELVRRSK